MTLAQRYRHVVIEGPIGAGKTTLAGKLAATLGASTLLEQPAANPFLQRFYRDSRRHALATQLAFLLQRMRQMDELRQLDASGTARVCDFLIDKDALFARLTLADDELALYRELHAQLATRLQAPPPDLVIFLQAPPEQLLARIARRGDPVEAGITEPYLRAVVDAYTDLVHGYQAAPVLIVDTAHLNPIDRPDDYALLLERVERMRGRRQHFNLAV